MLSPCQVAEAAVSLPVTTVLGLLPPAACVRGLLPQNGEGESPDTEITSILAPSLPSRRRATR
jgi:hypothetical protein